MKNIATPILIGMIIFTSFLLAHDWPLKPFNQQHQINSTFGEYRSGHFHQGVDIKPFGSTTTDSFYLAYSILSDTAYRTNGANPGVRVGKYYYIHLDNRVDSGTYVTAFQDTIGRIQPSENHLHFHWTSMYPPIVDTVFNPLWSDALSPYVDSTNPYIDSIKFYRQGTSTQLIGNLDGKIDILSVAGDTRTDSTGHSTEGNCSVYRIGYEVKDTLGNFVKPLWEKIKFDTIPNPSSSSQLSLTYGPGSTLSHFRYWVTNDPFNSNANLRNWYWNTKQKAGAPDSVDAASIEDARFEDGRYWVKVTTSDIRNNTDVESVTVVIANFQPKVKLTVPTNGETDVALDQHIYVKFSEAMDQRLSLWQAISISPGVSGDWQWFSDKEIDFTPDPSFVENTTYTVSLSSQLKDLQGQELVPYEFSFTTGTASGPQAAKLDEFTWENVTSWDVSGSWATNYYYFQYLYFSFPFYGYLYEIIIFNRRGSIWFNTWYDLAHFDLPTAGGTNEPVIAVYNDSLHHYSNSFGGSKELSNPQREVVRWRYNWLGDTTEFEAVLHADGLIRFDYRKCDMEMFYNDGGSGISKGDGINYSSITERYGPVYELAPASFIFTTNPPPGKPKDLEAYWPIRSELVNLTWRQNPEPDLEGYNVYRRRSDSLKYAKLGFTTENNYTDSLVQLGKTYVYRATAVDTLNLESAYSDSVVVEYGPRTVNNPLATAYNNASRMVYKSTTGDLFLAYSADDTVLWTLSFDDGTTWSHSAAVGSGSFPSMILNSDTSPCCVFRNSIETDFGITQFYDRKLRNNRWLARNNLFSVDSDYISISKHSISTSSASTNATARRTLTYTISYAWFEYENWYEEILYETYDSIMSVSFVIDPLDTGWVVFNTYDDQGNNNLKIGQFYTQTLPESLEYVTTLDTYSSMGLAAMAVTPSDSIIYIVYERDGNIVCKWRNNSGVWFTRTIQEEGIYPCLSIAQAGDLVHLIWERYYLEQDRREIQTCYTKGGLFVSQKPKTIAVVNDENCYPYIEKGAIAVWEDKYGNQREVYSSQRTESGGWTTPENISQTETDSKYPQVAWYQTGSETKIVYVWTEGDQAPYEVKTLPVSSRSNPLPLYAFDLGEEEPSVFLEQRTGHIVYGDGFEKSADYGTDFLHYKITGLDPDKLYRLRLVFYQDETNRLWQQDIEIDNRQIKKVNLPRKKVIAEEILLSEEDYRDGVIALKIKESSGQKVVLSAMSVYEFTKEEYPVSFGVEANSNVPHKLEVFVSPNPVRSQGFFNYRLPKTGQITIKIYSVLGQLMREIKENKSAGLHTTIWDGEDSKGVDVASGIYFYSVESTNEVKTGKIIFLR